MFSSRRDVWVYLSELSAYWMPVGALQVTPGCVGGSRRRMNVHKRTRQVSESIKSGPDRGGRCQQAAAVVSVKRECHQK